MKRILCALLAGSIVFTSNGQSVIGIIKDDIPTAKKLIEAYFTPMAESFGSGLNNGWYNTAKTHSLGGFDLTFTINTVIIPNSAENFKIGDEFENVFISEKNEAASIFGSTNKTEMIYTNSYTDSSFSFTMPGGLKTPVFPLPMVQAGIGLVKNTAVDIRYMPMMNIGDNINVDLFGIGLKHDVLQWIPALGNAIPMSLSLQGGYTSLNTELKVLGQKVALNTRATTINLVASKKILMVTGYAGIGYNSSKTTFSADANFELNGIKFEENIEAKFESNNDLKTNIGLRLNMAIVTIQADYTFSKYPTATLGLGVSLR